uniref:Uncharacterized protein n=1 Tax=Tanacetum cinerariifolium TaxID=118510 RepID=A0A6L2L2N7_TANCI|nr:hypothetical protein [Tanacetum cinerariifolium]
MDEALVPHARRLRIGRRNFRLLSDISSKESTLQLVYDVLRLTPFFKAFLVTVAIINKCLTKKSSGYDNLQLSQAQILWGLYHKRNVDFAYLMWEDFVYQVEHKDTKKSNEMNSDAYKEYYTVATGATPPKTKASVRKIKSSSDTTITPPLTTTGLRLSTSAKGKQPAITSKANSLTALIEEGSDDEQAPDEEEFIHPSLSTHDEEEMKDGESFDPIPKTPKNTDDEGNDEENLGMYVGREEGQDEEDAEDELYKDVNINLGRVMLNPTPNAGIESIFESTSQMDVQTPTSVAPLPVSAPTLTPSTITTQMNEAVKVAVQIHSDRLCDEAQAENDEFLKTIDENMQKIIKERVKEQVKVQVSKILPKIEQIVNEQLEVEVLTRSSNSSKTSYAVAAVLLEMELKKILIEKIEGNKSIHQSNKQRNLYNAFIEAYEYDKIILDTYGYTVTLKRRRDVMRIKTKNPPLDQTGGPRDEEKERSQTSKSATAEEPMQTTHEMEEPSHLEFETDCDWNKTLPATHRSIQPWISDLAKQTDSRSSFNELMDTLVDFFSFLMNRLKVDTLTLELLVGPTYELIKGSCKSLVELKLFLEEVYKATIDQLDWVNPKDYGHIKWIEDLVPWTMWIQEPVGYDKHALWGISRWGCKHQQFYGFVVNQESARDVYSKRRIIAVTELKIVEWHNYKHLDWITVRRDDDKFYKIKEGDFKRLRIQDIEDISIIIQRCVEDLQLVVESYQKKLNLTRPDTDGTLTDVRTTLDDRLKGIRIKYLPQIIWRKSYKERVAAMIQAIEKMLKTRRIMRSLERFVGERLYKGDFRMLQRTI